MENLLNSDKLKFLKDKINVDSNATTGSKSLFSLNHLEKTDAAAFKPCKVILQRAVKNTKKTVANKEKSVGDNEKLQKKQQKKTTAKTGGESMRVTSTESVNRTQNPDKRMFAHSLKVPSRNNGLVQECSSRLAPDLSLVTSVAPEVSRVLPNCSRKGSDFSRLTQHNGSVLNCNAAHRQLNRQAPDQSRRYNRLVSDQITQPPGHCRPPPDHYGYARTEDQTRLGEASLLSRSRNISVIPAGHPKAVNRYRKIMHDQSQLRRDYCQQLNGLPLDCAEYSRVGLDYSQVAENETCSERGMITLDNRNLMRECSGQRPAGCGRIDANSTGWNKKVPQMCSIPEESRVALEPRSLSQSHQGTTSIRNEFPPLKKKFLVDGCGFLIPQRTETFRLAYYTNHSKQLETELINVWKCVIDSVNKVEAEFYTYTLQKYILGLTNMQIQKGIVAQDKEMLASLTQIDPSMSENTSVGNDFHCERTKAAPKIVRGYELEGRNQHDNSEMSIGVGPHDLMDHRRTHYTVHDYSVPESSDSSDEELHEIRTETRKITNKRKSTEQIITTNKRLKVCPSKGVKRNDRVMHSVTRVVTPARKQNLNFTMELRSHKKKTNLVGQLGATPKVRHNITQETRYTVLRSRRRQKEEDMGEGEREMCTPTSTHRWGQRVIRKTPRYLPGQPRRNKCFARS